MKKIIGFTKVLLFVFMFTLMIFMFGCGVVDGKNDIYGNNDKISKPGDSYSFQSRIGKTDEKNMDVEYDKFTGVQTIWTINVTQNGEIEIYVDSQVKKGDFKVVLVTPDQEVIKVLESTGDETSTVPLSKGKYSIKIVGKNSKGTIKINLSVSDGAEVSLQNNDM